MSAETKALMKACKVSRTKDRTFATWLKAIKDSNGKEDAPEVQKARKAFKDAEAEYRAIDGAIDDLLDFLTGTPQNIIR